MKKILILALLSIAAVGVVLLFPVRSAGKVYPRNTVITAVNSSATAIGAVLDEQRTVSGQLRAGRFGRVGLWLRDIMGQDLPDDIDELLVSSGPDKVTITSWHRNGNVERLRIRPFPDSSKLSADMRREVIKSLPGVRFDP